MAIQNRTFFRVIGGVADEAGASQISVSDGVNIIGGGAVHEQEILLENSIHVYTTANRRQLLDTWSIGVTSDSTSKYVYKEATAAVVSFAVALESPALVRIKVDVRRTDTGASLSAYTGSNQASPTTESQTQTWSTVQDVYLQISLAPVANTTDAILWGFRALEDQTSL
jgi:hypothetical protein